MLDSIFKTYHKVHLTLQTLYQYNESYSFHYRKFIMLKMIVSTFLFTAFFVHTAENEEITKQDGKFKQFLPSSLSSLKIDQTSQKQLIQVMGRPLKTDDNNNHFYNLSGRNYDTTIGITDNKISYILYSPPAGSLRFAQLKPYIEQQIINQAYQQKLKTDHTHSAGRTFDITLPGQNIRITVRNNTQETIQSILFLQ